MLGCRVLSLFKAFKAGGFDALFGGKRLLISTFGRNILVETGKRFVMRQRIPPREGPVMRLGLFTIPRIAEIGFVRHRLIVTRGGFL